jgi:hypothetical protein
MHGADQHVDALVPQQRTDETESDTGAAGRRPRGRACGRRRNPVVRVHNFVRIESTGIDELLPEKSG